MVMTWPPGSLRRESPSSVDAASRKINWLLRGKKTNGELGIVCIITYYAVVFEGIKRGKDMLRLLNTITERPLSLSLSLLVFFLFELTVGAADARWGWVWGKRWVVVVSNCELCMGDGERERERDHFRRMTRPASICICNALMWFDLLLFLSLF